MLSQPIPISSGDDHNNNNNDMLPIGKRRTSPEHIQRKLLRYCNCCCYCVSKNTQPRDMLESTMLMWARINTHHRNKTYLELCACIRQSCVNGVCGALHTHTHSRNRRLVTYAFCGANASFFRVFSAQRAGKSVHINSARHTMHTCVHEWA